jgi:hypothetical protein
MAKMDSRSGLCGVIEILEPYTPLSRRQWRSSSRADEGEAEKRQGQGPVSSPPAIPEQSWSGCPDDILGTHTIEKPHNVHQRFRLSYPKVQQAIGRKEDGQSQGSNSPHQVAGISGGDDA